MIIKFPSFRRPAPYEETSARKAAIFSLQLEMLDLTGEYRGIEAHSRERGIRLLAKPDHFDLMVAACEKLMKHFRDKGISRTKSEDLQKSLKHTSEEEISALRDAIEIIKSAIMLRPIPKKLRTSAEENQIWTNLHREILKRYDEFEDMSRRLTAPLKDISSVETAAIRLSKIPSEKWNYIALTYCAEDAGQENEYIFDWLSRQENCEHCTALMIYTWIVYFNYSYGEDRRPALTKIGLSFRNKLNAGFYAKNNTGAKNVNKFYYSEYLKIADLNRDDNDWNFQWRLKSSAIKGFDR